MLSAPPSLLCGGDADDRPSRPQPPLRQTAGPEPSAEAVGKIDVNALNFYYGPRRVLEQITVSIRPNEVTALIGPFRLRQVHVPGAR